MYPGIEKQPDHYQNNYKSSWFYDNASPDDIDALRKRLEEGELDTNVIYSSSRHLDVLPKFANKGNSLSWLLKFLEMDPKNALVAGDSGNDSAMFTLHGINGIVVGNAQPELLREVRSKHVFHSEKIAYEGVIEGLMDYEIIKPLNKKNWERLLQRDELTISTNFLDLEEVTGLTNAQYEFVMDGYEKALQALKRNITKMGFAACSLDDNEIVGTDANYRSVWARDGAIAITGSISLIDDAEIRECQRITLKTLLDHVTPNGQIPSNVSIDSEKPDYSGVGGICSIDSGLWVIIAFHDFIKASHDIDFLREHYDSLMNVMDWLGAQDGNNDALLEIPEAGDWTDLFGRSYNVLYDEVLWYRANICFGRMLELLGKNEKAGDYISWSQIIKREILINFWPTTKNSLYDSITFAEQQFSLGDARYLLAQVTPFDFSWRCDVYGNILAFLYDVVNKEKALQTFRFMWGAGVNDPYPVSNVYPAVNPGDPDWRPYYTVNLLNLPQHYHNGGKWPFVGGAWVRYLNKLGLRNTALNELFKLAELNHQGVNHDWEFNEWAHGRTGRPMGKSFQTWSITEYIAACHDLKLTQKLK